MGTHMQILMPHGDLSLGRPETGALGISSPSVVSLICKIMLVVYSTRQCLPNTVECGKRRYSFLLFLVQVFLCPLKREREKCPMIIKNQALELIWILMSNEFTTVTEGTFIFGMAEFVTGRALDRWDTLWSPFVTCIWYTATLNYPFWLVIGLSELRVAKTLGCMPLSAFPMALVPV